MLLINCPHCGPRDEHEFSYGGEAHIVRPKHPEKLSDAEWADYLFLRTNPKGTHRERWCHAHGCRRWFNVERDTLSHKITAVYKMGEKPPAAGRKTTSQDKTQEKSRDKTQEVSQAKTQDKSQGTSQAKTQDKSKGKP